VPHSGWYVTWYVCGQLTFNYRIANYTWPDAHYGIAEFEKYREASNWDRMRVIILWYARRRMRVRVKESFNESFLRLTLWRHVTWRSDVTFSYALTSRRVMVWRHVFLHCDITFSYALTSRRVTVWRHIFLHSDVTSRDGLTSHFLTLWRHVFTSRPPAIRHIHVKNICIPHSFLVINACNRGKTLCSPCIFAWNSILHLHFHCTFTKYLLLVSQVFSLPKNHVCIFCFSHAYCL